MSDTERREGQITEQERQFFELKKHLEGGPNMAARMAYHGFKSALDFYTLARELGDTPAELELHERVLSYLKQHEQLMGEQLDPSRRKRRED